MAQTRPNIAKAFASGAVFGASAFTLLGLATAVTGGTVLGVANPILGLMYASAIGAATFGPLAAATNFIIHTIPGLASALGQEHTGRQIKSKAKGLDFSSLDPVRMTDAKYLSEADRDILVSDHILDQHSNHVQDLEAERIEAMQAREQSMVHK